MAKIEEKENILDTIDIKNSIDYANRKFFSISNARSVLHVASMAGLLCIVDNKIFSITEILTRSVGIVDSNIKLISAGIWGGSALAISGLMTAVSTSMMRKDGKKNLNRVVEELNSKGASIGIESLKQSVLLPYTSDTPVRDSLKCESTYTEKNRFIMQTLTGEIAIAEQFKMGIKSGKDYKLDKKKSYIKLLDEQIVQEIMDANPKTIEKVMSANVRSHK